MVVQFDPKEGVPESAPKPRSDICLGSGCFRGELSRSTGLEQVTKELVEAAPEGLVIGDR